MSDLDPTDPVRSDPTRSDPARAGDQEDSMSSSDDPTWAGGSHRDATVAPPAPDAPSGPAVGTLVWGCVVLAVAALLGARELAGLRLDLSLVVPVGMVVLGLLLVVGAVATAVRSNRG